MLVCSEAGLASVITLMMGFSEPVCNDLQYFSSSLVLG